MPVGQNAKKAEANFFCELPIRMFMVGIVATWVLAPSYALAREYFVSPVGDDVAEGSSAKPWRTIQRAADVAQPGDVVTIRGGVYREWVKPENAGREDAPIVYQAAKGERVVVTGADPVTGWKRRSDGLWEAKVRYDSFRGMNPFADNIFGATGSMRRAATTCVRG